MRRIGRAFLEGLETFVISILGILMFLLVLEAAMAVHEYGHLTEMQKRGVEVGEYSLGVGPVFYQREMPGGYTLSLRVIPIMAYVSPTDAGNATFESLPLNDQLMIYFAGVRNNLISGLLAVFALLFVSVCQSRMPLWKFIVNVAFSPLRVLLWLFQFTLQAMTLNKVRFEWRPFRVLLSDKACFSLFPVHLFITLSFMLGFFNLWPLAPLDGGQMFLTVAAQELSLMELAFLKGACFGLLVFYFVALNITRLFLPFIYYPS